MTDSQKAYIAGIVDGEGNISIGKRKVKGCVNPSFTSYVKITNTDKRMLDWVMSVVGLGSICSPKIQKRRRRLYHWTICDVESETFLKSIYDFLVIKKEQAEIVFRFRETFLNKKQNKTEPAIVEVRQRLFDSLQSIHQGKL